MGAISKIITQAESLTLSLRQEARPDLSGRPLLVLVEFVGCNA